MFRELGPGKGGLTRYGSATSVTGLRRDSRADLAGQAPDHKQQREMPSERNWLLARYGLSDADGHAGDVHQVPEHAVVQAESTRGLEDRRTLR